MKTRAIKFTAIAVFLAMTVFAFGSNDGNLTANLNLKNNNVVEINLNSDAALTITVNVYNNAGSLVLNKTLEEQGSQKFTHRISDFPEGIYTYEVVEGDEVVYTARIVKSDNGSVECRNLPAGAVASISQPSADMVLVRMVKDAGTKSKIRVTDNDGSVIYSKTVKNDGTSKITHDISSFPEGTYAFTVYSNNEMIAYRKITR